MSKWICKICGYVHEGETAPEQCPICKAPASQFEKVEEEKKSKYGKKRRFRTNCCYF